MYAQHICVCVHDVCMYQRPTCQNIFRNIILMCSCPWATQNIGRGPCRNHHKRSQVVGLVIVRLALNQNTSHIGRLPTPYVQYVLPFAQAHAANFSQNAPKTRTHHTLNICVDRQYKTWQQTKTVKAWWKILPCNSLSTCIPHACVMRPTWLDKTWRGQKEGEVPAPPRRSTTRNGKSPCPGLNQLVGTEPLCLAQQYIWISFNAGLQVSIGLQIA